MLNVVYIKTWIPYWEHATHTSVQDSNHEQAIRNSLVQTQVRIGGQDWNINKLTNLIIIPHLGKIHLRET